MQMKQDSFAAKLRECRKRKGLSIRKAARLLELSPSTLQRYESGIGSPSIARLSKIAIVLNLEVKYQAK
jgi:transcriptional regulator with XRE-family HTH domain